MTARLLLLAAALTAGARAPAADVVTLAGARTAGALVRVGPDAVEVRPDAGPVARVPVKDLAAVDLKNPVVAPAKDARYDEVELTDGSVLRVGQLKVTGKAVEPGFLPGPAGVPHPVVDLPIGTLSWVMRGADDPNAREAWKKLLAGRGKRDLFVVRQAGGLNPLPGTVVEGTGDRVVFERETGQRASLPLARATGGLVFNQPPRDAVPPTVCRVHDVFGNVLYAAAVEVAGSGLKVRTVAGAGADYPSLAAVSKLDFSRGNVAYLSDLDAVAAYPPPEADGPLGDQYPLAPRVGKDRPIGPGGLVVGGREFAKGVAVPPDAGLVYALDGAYREFKAVAGLPDWLRPEAAALRLRVEVDGRPAFDEVLTKGNPRELSLNVKDARELRVTVERAGLLLGNQVLLADARVQK